MRQRRGDIASLRYTAWGGAIYLRRDMALRAEPPVGAIHESPAKTTHIKKLVILSFSEGSLNAKACGGEKQLATPSTAQRSFAPLRMTRKNHVILRRRQDYPRASRRCRFFHSLRLTAWGRKRIIILSNPARSVRS